MSGLAKSLTEDQVLRRVVEKVCEQVWSQDKTAIKKVLGQPEYRAVKTYHEGKPVYVAQHQPVYVRMKK